MSRAALVQNAASMDWRVLEGVATVAISAGASAPEELVEELIEACRERFAVDVQEVRVVQEDVVVQDPADPGAARVVTVTASCMRARLQASGARPDRSG